MNDNENKVDSECYCAASMAFVSEKLSGAEPPHLHNMDKNENMKLIATLGVICKALSKCFCKIHRKMPLTNIRLLIRILIPIVILSLRTG